MLLYLSTVNCLFVSASWSIALIGQSMSFISGNNMLTYLIVQENTDLDALSRVYGICYEWGWPIQSLEVSMLLLGFAWCLVPRQTGDWPSSKRLASSWHKVAIYRCKHPATHIFLAKEENRNDSAPCITKEYACLPQVIEIFDRTLIHVQLILSSPLRRLFSML